MSRKALSNPTDEITKLVGTAPPVAEFTLRGGTRVTGRWVNDPYEGYVGAMSDHVIAATFEGLGESVARIDGKRLSAPCRSGGITLAPKEHDGHWRTSGRISVSNLYLGHDRLLSFTDQTAEGRVFELLDRVHHPDPQLFAIMAMIAREVESPQHHSPVFMEHAIDLLCLQLMRAHSTLDKADPKPIRGLPPWQVKRVVAYMRDHVAADISLQDLSDVVGMSRFHFCSAFRSATGSTPHEYLTRVRMKVACSYLVDTDLPVKSIAALCGYSTASAFSAVFHRAMGQTPRQFRRKG
jgi:AraC family transcriptional regulator